MAYLANIEFVYGEHVLLTITMSPVTDVTGYTAVFTIRDRYSRAVLLQSEMTVYSAPSGQLQVTLSATDTLIEPGVYDFDVWRTNSGAAAELTSGLCVIRPGAYAPGAYA